MAFFARSPSVWMITPQLTEQYGQVLRVSLVRAIFSVRACAITGATSKPNAVSVAPPTSERCRKVRLEIMRGSFSYLRVGPHPHAPATARSRSRRWLLACCCSVAASQKFATGRRKRRPVVDSDAAQVGSLDAASEGVAEVWRQRRLDVRIRIEDDQIRFVANVDRAFAIESGQPRRRLGHPLGDLIE